ncbi:hypothetical protein Bca4012_001934 [Brassica carinata]
MTNLTYVSRFSFILIPYRFKVRDRFSAYTTCMVGTEHLSKDNLCFEKMLVRMTVWSSKKVFLSRKEISSKNESSGVCDVSRC